MLLIPRQGASAGAPWSIIIILALYASDVRVQDANITSPMPYILHVPHVPSLPAHTSSSLSDRQPDRLTTLPSSSPSGPEANQWATRGGSSTAALDQATPLRVPLVQPAFDPVQLLQYLPGIPMRSTTFLEQLRGNESSNANLNRLSASARHSPMRSGPSIISTHARRGRGRGSRGARFQHGRSSAIQASEEAVTRVEPILSPPTALSAAPSGNPPSSGRRQVVVTVVVLPCPLGGIPDVFPLSDNPGPRLFGGLDNDRIRILLARFGPLGLLYRIDPSVSTLSQLDEGLRSHLARHRLQFPLPPLPHTSEGRSRSPQRSLASSSHGEYHWQFVRPGPSSGDYPGPYQPIDIDHARPLVQQLKTRYAQWRNPDQTYARDVLAFVEADHIMMHLSSAPVWRHTWIPPSGSQPSSGVPGYSHPDDSCLGPSSCLVPSISAPLDARTDVASETTPSQSMIPTRRPHSASPPSSVLLPPRPITRPRLSIFSTSPISQEEDPFHVDPPSSPTPGHMNASAIGRPYESNTEQRASLSPFASDGFILPHAIPTQNGNRSSAESPGAALSLHSGMPESPSLNATFRASLSPPSTIEIIDLTRGNDSDSSECIVLGGFTIDACSDDDSDDDGLAWQPKTLGNLEYRSQVSCWQMQARRELPELPSEMDVAFTAELYPGQPDTHTESAIDSLSMEITATFWKLLRIAYPPSPTNSFGWRRTAASIQHILTHGRGPSVVTLSLALQNYLTYKPQAFCTTPDGYIGINPSSGYHPTERLFWRGVGILCSIWILHAASPPFSISPFLCLVALSDDPNEAAQHYQAMSYVRTFAPKAADLIVSWDRLAPFHVSEAPSVRTKHWPPPKYKMATFRPHLEALDIDISASTSENMEDFKLTRNEHSRIRSLLLCSFLFGHPTCIQSEQFSAFVEGWNFFDDLRFFYANSAFPDIPTLVYVVWRDITINPTTFLQQRIQWAPPDEGANSSDWLSVKKAFSRFLERDGAPRLSDSAASDALRALYPVFDIDPDANPTPSGINQPHIRRILLNRLVLGVDRPPADAKIKVSNFSLVNGTDELT
ncbi:hypothetical protein CALCODRAFT_505686 [Calocera cornea HHB12733]|uniref:Uncharacterized protein n=1 Tax=Calocera cornea HHB12733 TaxID=1353952 RepID=A0A165JXN9_9BASI|nr:hypothetical protein CALCODRAFT_505686 [Calocera cornea HHB12733]